MINTLPPSLAVFQLTNGVNIPELLHYEYIHFQTCIFKNQWLSYKYTSRLLEFVIVNNNYTKLPPTRIYTPTYVFN
jgi:hypothetical protein